MVAGRMKTRAIPRSDRPGGRSVPLRTFAGVLVAPATGAVAVLTRPPPQPPQALASPCLTPSSSLPNLGTPGAPHPKDRSGRRHDSWEVTAVDLLEARPRGAACSN